MPFFLRQRVVIAFLIALASLIGMIAGTTWLVLRQRAEQGWVDHTYEVQLRFSRIWSLLQELEARQLKFVITKDENYLEPYASTIDRLNAELAALGEKIADNAEQVEALAGSRQIVAQELNQIQRVVESARNSRDADTHSLLDASLGENRMLQLQSAIETMMQREQALLNKRKEASQTSEFWIQIVDICALLSAIGLGILALNDTRHQFNSLSSAHKSLKQANQRLNLEAQHRLRLEDQLRHVQKMDAIGQLTGGIAHDFNNMLAVIMGSLNLVRRRTRRGETDFGDLIDQALEGAERAAALTSRLLAFARQQALAPQPLDANSLVAGISDLIRRSLGEFVTVETVLSGGLWLTSVDPGQLESAILNLAVNGRDAMPRGGKLTIETANATLDEAYASENLDAPAGQYVLLTVTDTGIGMTPDVMARAFEPFFTTKTIGQGTGMGLSQVYGFVKQSGGHVKIYSEPGRGTVIKVYLPRYFGDLKPMPRAGANQSELPVARTKETLLVVEDEERMLRVAVEALRDLNYTVFHASNAAAALRNIDSHPEISLLFTDVVMADMSGHELAKEAVRRSPALRVLYTTGFNRNAVSHNSVLDPTVNFLAKPYTFEQLARKIRSVLDIDRAE
jgi:signal transduction histidine kinase/ActR/RegA family two-component response regulator